MSKNQSAVRRKPSQARALRTRELIFEAAVQILERDGEAALTTNRLAEHAGLSVGTVYQYFANKEEILTALTAQERQLRMQLIANELRSAWGQSVTTQDLPERVRAILLIVLDAFGGRHRARRILLEKALRSRAGGFMGPPVAEIAHMLCGARDKLGAPALLTEIDAFVLAEAMAGAIRGALMKNPNLLKTPAFVQSLVDLTVGFLLQRRAATSPSGAGLPSA